MTSQSPSPQGISALLKRAGFTQAVVKLRGGTSGFRVSAGTAPGGPAAVRVRHYTIFGTRTHEGRMLAKYAAAITNAGWSVETGEYELIVTTGKAAQ